MSVKGNFAHNKYGCDRSRTLNDISVAIKVKHDHPGINHLDSSSADVEYIESIQDGFRQSDILCEFDPNLDSEESPLEGSSKSHIIDSLPCVSSIDRLVHGFDDQLDGFLLQDFKKEPQANDQVKADDIAYLEDLLPEEFDTKDDEDGLMLSDFERCPPLHSPSNSLDLNEQLPADAQGLELELFTQPTLPPPRLLKPDEPIAEHNQPYPPLSNQDTVIGASLSESDESPFPLSEESEIDPTQLLTDIGNDIPTVSISDINSTDCLTDIDGTSTAGTVVITRDKHSKKMQIVLTFDQGQQVFDIDTESLSANQSLDLDLQNAIVGEEFVETEELERPEVASDCLVFDTHNYAGFIHAGHFIKPRKTKMQYVCTVPGCGQVLDKESKLRVHLMSHQHGKRPFKCEFPGCSWSFTTPYRLRRHMDTHGGSKEFICDVEGCNRKFTTVYNLKTHKKRHKYQAWLACPSPECTRRFENRRALELHLRVHEDVAAPYVCQVCGKQYYSANCIASHYRIHQYNADDFRCPFAGCGRVYDKVCRLRQHVRHHTGDRPYRCTADGCGWSFMSASKLTRHMRKHTGERRFTCCEPGCGKSFMRPEHLKGHVVIHSGDKPFHCPHQDCKARFTAKSSLYVHVKKHCSSVLKVVYPCVIPSCLKKYNSKANLKQHLLKSHSDEIQDIKSVVFKEELQLTMPVALVGQDAEETNADDPLPSFKKELTKSTNVRNPSRPAESAKKKSQKVVKKNSNGCARADFLYSESVRAKSPLLFFSQNSLDNQDSKTADVRSLDVMLASSIIFNEQTSESNFLPEDLYQEDSVLVGGSSTFSSELLQVSLLSEESDESGLNHASGVFLEPTDSVEAFASILD